MKLLKNAAIILVRPQMGENIGKVARAMKNCNFSELRIVAPRDGWPNERAIAASSGATDLLENALIFDSVTQAVADLETVFATTARDRDLNKPCITLDHDFIAERKFERFNLAKTGVLFGCERTGLENSELSLADHIITVPLNPEFSSLNLSQAVLLVCHSIYISVNENAVMVESDKAPKERMTILFEHLLDMLDDKNFFKSPDMRDTQIMNIKAMLLRAELTPQEVNTLHGIIVTLTGKKWTRD